jgi:hypothetical protein
VETGRDVPVVQNLHERKIDDRLFWSQNPCIVFDVYMPIALSSMGEITSLPILFIDIRCIILTVRR